MLIDDTDDKDEVLDSSPKTDQDAAPAKTGAPVDSSPTEDVAKATLSVVRDVVEAGGDGGVAQSASSAEGPKGGNPSDDAPKARDNENFTDVPFHKHPRFQELLREVKVNRQDATRYRNVQQFLDRNGLAPEEAADALLVASLLRTDPVQAWNRLRPVVQSLLQAVGEVIPADLERRVTAGELTPDAALEVSRARASAESQRRASAFESSRMQQQRAQMQSQTLVAAASAWESDRRTKDPNFEAKLPLLMDALAGIQYREGKPQSPEGVQLQLIKAYEVVNSRFVPSVAPGAKPAVRTVNSASATGSAQEKPVSTIDIIRSVRARR